MSLRGEIEYLCTIGAAGKEHAQNKPFSDELCGLYLQQIGAVMLLLPPPPATLLDIGCGTGWTSYFLARRGYTVTGIDIAPEMIHCAQEKYSSQCDSLTFETHNYEEKYAKEQYDNVLFFDALHHAEDEAKALQTAYTALKPGGTCVIAEPGKGHHKKPHSIHAIKEYGVTEKEMPPYYVKRIAKSIGFREAKIYPHATITGKILYNKIEKKWLSSVLKLPFMRACAGFFYTAFYARNNGIIIVKK